MGKLTRRINAEISKGLTYEAIIYKDIEHHETDFNYKALEKLAHYEDLEEQGRLLKLKFNLGQKVYDVRYEEDDHHSWYEIREWSFREDMYNCQDRYYATKEEAEAKLAELKGTEE